MDRVRTNGQPGVRSIDIVAIGEAMVELNQTSQADGCTYLQGFGGDTSNALIAAARQGAKGAYVTKLGDDEFGRMCLELWRDEGIDTEGVGIDTSAYTGIYFVRHNKDGHTFSYLRTGSAASRMQPADVPAALIERAHYLHVSGISQAISASATDTVFHAIRVARAAGVRVAYDPNLRLKLWPLDRARAVIPRGRSSAGNSAGCGRRARSGGHVAHASGTGCRTGHSCDDSAQRLLSAEPR